MSCSTQEEQARLVALPTAIPLAVLVSSEDDPMYALRGMMDRLDFVQEVKQAYPEHVLIQGICVDAEIPPRVLHLSSLTERETVLHELHLSIEHVSGWLGTDIEGQAFRAFLAALVKKLAKAAGKGLFGNEPLIVKRQKDYLPSLEHQFSQVSSYAAGDADR